MSFTHLWDLATHVFERHCLNVSRPISVIVAWLGLTHKTEMFREPVFGVAWCCQPQMGHPNLKMDMMMSKICDQVDVNQNGQCNTGESCGISNTAWVFSMLRNGNKWIICIFVIPTASTKLKGGYTGITLSVCLSVCLSIVGQNRVGSVSSTHWIHFIFAHLIKQLNKVCHA